jgi:uncharacterized repeat protein (TIGR01451 family)
MKKSIFFRTIPIVLAFWISFFQHALAQIPDYVPTNGLVGWWPLDGNANDLSTNQLDGSIYNSSIATNRFGELNSAYSFNGNNSYIEVPHNYQLNSLPITISIWFLPSQVNGGGPLVSKYMNASWNGWNVGISGPSDSTETMSGHYILQSPYVWGSNPCNCGCRGVIEGYGDCGSGITYRSELYDQQWHLSTFVVDSVGGRFYLDGQPVSSQVWAGLPQQVSNWYGMLIGAYRTSGQWSYYKGKLDDLGIWNRALTDQEISSLYVTSDCQPSAHVYNDYGQTCANTNLGVGGVIMQIQPGNYVVQSDLNGDFYLCDLNLEDGNYVASINPAEFGWESNCPVTQAFQVLNGAIDSQPTFLVFSDEACPSPDVSIVCPTMRRCSEHTWPIYVQACNDDLATGVLEDAYVQVQLDENIIVDPATTPPYTMVDGLYQFELGDIVPGECVNLVINANFSCELDLGETLCMEATLYPVPECLEDTVPVPGPCELPWDRSSLSVNGICDEANGMIVFTITNGGEDMDCQTEVRLYIDGVLDTTFYIQLGAGETYTYSVPATGQTYILQADQHPLHPGSSHPNDHVEACGGDSDWTPGLVDDLPSGDESPFVDVFCGEVVGSFDPNDKQGFPDGVGESHDILPNGQIQYLIRFQNTGTAPAYTVTVRDTLDTDLDIFSVTPGVSSHEYSFMMYGDRILQWTFNNIMLPDSFSNEEESHGFFTYTVNQLADLASGTEITNSAAIYFDSNEPVITNTTLHTINNCLFLETYATLEASSVGSYVGPDGQSYDQSGSYTIILINSVGCDSIITLNLNIEQVLSCGIQANQSYTCLGEEISLGTVSDLDSYLWSTGENTSAIVVSPVETTTYSVVVNQGEQTCNSEITIQVLPSETYFADADGDGFGNSDMPLTACEGMPEGYVMDNTDCDDSNADVYVSAICNDGDPCTVNDIILTDCSCAGTFADVDNDGTCDASDFCAGPEAGTPCDDNNACTLNDVINADCVCVGTQGVVSIPEDVSVSSSNICSGSSTTLTVQGALSQGQTWEWYAGSCGGELVGSGSSITVSPNVTTSYFVRSEGGDCDISDCLSVTVNVSELPSTPEGIVLPASVCRNSEITISVLNPITGMSYIWDLPNGWTITSGNGTATIQVMTSQSNGQIRVYASNACGTSSRYHRSVSPLNCNRSAEFSVEPLRIELWPNPANDVVRFAHGEIIPQSMVIYDTMGRVIYEGSWMNEMDVSSLAGGIYFVRATTNGESVVKRMEVVR